MIIKKWLITAALSFSAVSTFANTLTLYNHTANPVSVFCNGKQGIDIPPLKGNTPGKLPVLYILIKAIFPAGKPPLSPLQYSCDFSIATSPVGNAVIELSPNFQQAQIISYKPATGYSVSIIGDGVPVTITPTTMKNNIDVNMNKAV